MKGLSIVFLLLAVPAAIQCKSSLAERQSTTTTSQLAALIQSLQNALTGSGGALNGQGQNDLLSQLLSSLIGTNGTLTSLVGNPALGNANLVGLIQNLLNGLLKQGGTVQQLLQALGGNPDALKALLVFLLGPNGVVQSLLGPNGIVGQLLSGKPLNLQGIVQNLLSTLLGQAGVVPGLLNYLLGPNGLLKSGLLGNLLQPLVGTGGVLTNLVNGLLGLKGTDLVGSLQQLLQTLLGDLSNKPGSLGGLLGGLVNTLVGSNGVVTNLLQDLGLIPSGSSTPGGGGNNGNGGNTGNGGNNLANFLKLILSAYPALLNQILPFVNQPGFNGNSTDPNWQNVVSNIKSQLATNPGLLNLVLAALGIPNPNNNNNGNPTNGNGGNNGTNGGNSALGTVIQQLLPNNPGLANEILPFVNQPGFNGSSTDPNWQKVVSDIKNQLATNPALINLILGLLGVPNANNNNNGNPTNGNGGNNGTNGTNGTNSALGNTIQQLLPNNPGLANQILPFVNQPGFNGSSTDPNWQNVVNNIKNQLANDPGLLALILALLKVPNSNNTGNNGNPTNGTGPTGPWGQVLGLNVGPKGIIGKLVDFILGLLGGGIKGIFNALFGQKGLGAGILNVINSILKQTGLSKPAASVAKFLTTVANLLAGKGTILGGVGDLIKQLFDALTGKSGLIGSLINSIQGYLGGPKGATAPGIITAFLKFILLVLSGNLDVSTVLCKLKAVNPTQNLAMIAQPCLANVTNTVLNSELASEITQLTCTNPAPTSGRSIDAVTSERVNVPALGNLSPPQLNQLFDFNQCVFDLSRKGTQTTSG